MLPDDGHPEVGAVAAAEALRQVPAQEPRLVGLLAHPHQQRFPLGVGQSVALPVGARVLPAVVEEADVVVFLLDGLDDVVDERVQVVEQLSDVRGDGEVHARQPTRRPVIPPSRRSRCARMCHGGRAMTTAEAMSVLVWSDYL